MVKTLGELIMLGAGVLFICTIYYDPLLQTFLEMGINPFWACYYPLFFFGLLIVVVGFIMERI